MNKKKQYHTIATEILKNFYLSTDFINHYDLKKLSFNSHNEEFC